MRDELRLLASLAGPFPAFDIDLTPDEPRQLFSDWLRDAIVAGIKEPHAMVLSTVDENGGPDARVLILKNLDHRGWHFATTGNGPKGRQIALNPAVSLTFYWPALGRQVRLRGMALQAEVHERDADFRARAPGAKAVALTGRQSDVMGSRQELEDSLRDQHRRLEDEPALVAPSWALFIVMPHEAEFWQGDGERRHHRLRYRREKAGWAKEQLWP
ncbi:pyridoxal 5'-phosphate synthase [Rhizobium sp. NPDC092011]|uniref:pyridoxine/pyridoxamine 5'-phosphate oxidase n=1 Tax=Rhizobium sp. NPDC092011 TaxID=3364500 RepID=UPI003805B012